MKTYNYFFLTLALLQTAVFSSATGEPTTSPERPNFVLIYTDDLGKYDLEFYSEKTHDLTPNIDRLFKEGTTFSDAYAPAPLCAPSRVGLLSGRYPASVGAFEVAHGSPTQHRFADWSQTPLTPPENNLYLPETRTLPEYMKDLGYHTGFVGKWHIQSPALSRGFEYAVETRNVIPGGSHLQAVQVRSSEGDAPKTGERSDQFELRKSLDFIRSVEEDANPFFLYLATTLVHTPIEAQESLVDAYRGVSDPVTPTYYAMLKNLDNMVGELLAYLDEAGLTDETVIIFSSDNGVEGWDIINADTGPLRGIKKQLLEGGIRTPLVISYPALPTAGTVITQPVIHLDLLPTLVEMAGGQVEESSHDGESLLPLLEQSDEWPERTLFWHFPSYRGTPNVFHQRPASAMRKGKWKLIQSLENLDDLQLYNLEEDIGERKNLASKMPEMAARLRSELEDWRKAAEVTMPTP
jgi:arylsulfatase A-like enzyme